MGRPPWLHCTTPDGTQMEVWLLTTFDGVHFFAYLPHVGRFDSIVITGADGGPLPCFLE